LEQLLSEKPLWVSGEQFDPDELKNPRWLTLESAKELERIWKTKNKSPKTWVKIRTEGITEEVRPSDKYSEGAVRTVLVNAYERNPAAREKCIAHYGWTCAVCRFRMTDLYGKDGKEVIHVHHLRELSRLGKRYEVDPITDLRPVCPNCHAILHTRSPAMSIQQLRKLLAARKPIPWPGGR